MQEQKLFEKLMYRAQKTMQGCSENEKVVYALCCKVWSWKQEYRAENSPYRVSRKAYQSLIEELSGFEGRITKGAYEKEAKKAITEAKEWLEKAIGYRVPAPSNGKCRVF